MQEGKSQSGEKTQLNLDTISQQIENKAVFYESMAKRSSCLLIHKTLFSRQLSVHSPPQRLLLRSIKTLVPNLSRARNDPDPDGVLGSD